ncbi:hypothetical protein NEPAR04_2169 [Nematocida parisii]|nr:hypothetical protein NEPAR04_2169 [Nematocida parisii]
MQFKRFYKQLFITIAGVFALCAASTTKEDNSSDTESAMNAFYIDPGFGQNVYPNINCLPVCPPVNPCEQVCPPVNPCRPVCPPVNQCNIDPCNNPCNNPCNIDPCNNPCNIPCVDMNSQLDISSFFAALWKKILIAKKSPSKKAAIRALKRKMILLCKYAFQLLRCQNQGGAAEYYNDNQYCYMSLKALFSSLRWAVCSLDYNSQVCFLEYAYGVLCM